VSSHTARLDRGAIENHRLADAASEAQPAETSIPAQPSNQLCPKSVQSRLSPPLPNVAMTTEPRARIHVLLRALLDDGKPVGAVHRRRSYQHQGGDEPCRRIEVSSLAAEPRPTAASVVGASRACSAPGFIPMLSSHGRIEFGVERQCRFPWRR
jgi:hypothetical protein